MLHRFLKTTGGIIGEFLAVFCYLFGPTTPVRDEMEKHPGEYGWSSYGTNGQGEKADVITYHALYRSLGSTVKERQTAYRESFRHDLESSEIDTIRKATNGNFALGTDRK